MEHVYYNNVSLSMKESAGHTQQSPKLKQAYVIITFMKQLFQEVKRVNLEIYSDYL